MKVADMSALTFLLHLRGPEETMVADLEMSAFWMARLAELTYTKNSGPIPLKTGITATDTKRFEIYIATIDLHNAKTKKPGKFQIL